MPVAAFGQIPVIDGASLAASQAAHGEDIAKWVDSIGRLKTQIDQLNQQINIQGEIRTWQGNPAEAGAKILLGGLGRQDLVQQYGQAKINLLGLVDSLGSLNHTVQGNYRTISNVDLNGGVFGRDPITYRRYSVLEALQANSDLVRDATKTRETALQGDVAATLEQLKGASTDAEAQKLNAKLTALNGQLGQVDAARRREVDEVVLQKIANDSRKEEEMQAAAELAMRDDYLANQRITAYMQTIKVRGKTP
jgi:hypothetical protein